MSNYLALLRGINVGGQKKIPMAELRELLSKSGLEKVQTYIQSGNVLFQSSEEEKEKLEALIQNTIKSHFGFEVPILVLKPEDLQKIFDNCPFSEERKANSYFMMLYAAPEKDLVIEVSKLSYANETFIITNNVIYFYYSLGFGKAKCNTNFFERKLKVTATARNYKTMVKLLSLHTEM